MLFSCFKDVLFISAYPMPSASYAQYVTFNQCLASLPTVLSVIWSMLSPIVLEAITASALHKCDTPTNAKSILN